MQWLLSPEGGAMFHASMLSTCGLCDEACARWLVNEGFASITDVAGSDHDAYIWALTIGHVPTVQDLLRSGRGSVTDVNRNGYTGLLIAAAHGYLPLVQWLLSPEGGASVSDACDSGRTAVMMAACEGHLHIVRWLLSPEGGASVRDVDMNGATIQFHATGLLFTYYDCDNPNEYETMLCLLSEYGADINHVYDYDSPLDTIWKYRECEVFGNAHNALTPLLKVMTLLDDVPPSFKPRLSAEHALIMQEGPLLRARLPAYLERRQLLLVVHYPLPDVLQSLFVAYAKPAWEEKWDSRLQ
jgi:hypothetical protein